MSRLRFQALTASITFDDIETRTIRHRQFGKFYLINDLFEIIRKRVVAALSPGANLAVDEQLYAFRGRCPFRQYMKSKPNKYGIKYWAIGCVDSGYLCDFNVYLGKSKENSQRNAKVGENVISIIILIITLT